MELETMMTDKKLMRWNKMHSEIAKKKITENDSNTKSEKLIFSVFIIWRVECIVFRFSAI